MKTKCALWKISVRVLLTIAEKTSQIFAVFVKNKEGQDLLSVGTKTALFYRSTSNKWGWRFHVC